MKKIATKSGEVWIEDGIIRSKVLTKGEYTLEMAKEDGDAFRALARKIKGEKLLLVEPGDIMKISLKTRRFQASEGPKIVDKIAQVVENPVTRAIVSIYLGLSKMPIPMRMFDTADSAAKWLKGKKE